MALPDLGVAALAIGTHYLPRLTDNLVLSVRLSNYPVAVLAALTIATFGV